MESLVNDLSTHLRNLRRARGLTLADIARSSGISKASLSRIENADVSPTAQTLAKLSAALQVPMSQIVSPLEITFEPLIKRSAQPVFRDETHGFLRRSVSPPNAHLSLELLECRLDPDAFIAYDTPSVPAHEHHFVLLDGTLSITVDATCHQLEPGDCLRYRLTGSTTFQAGPDGARYMLALA